MSQTGAIITRRRNLNQPTMRVPDGYKFTVRVNRESTSERTGRKGPAVRLFLRLTNDLNERLRGMRVTTGSCHITWMKQLTKTNLATPLSCTRSWRVGTYRR